jgi:hypothetical protein
MEYKGIEGPWYVENIHEPSEGKYAGMEIDISSEYNNSLCTIWVNGDEDDKGKYTAQLISHSPEMLQMLIDVLENKSEVDYDKIKQLIQNATNIE